MSTTNPNVPAAVNSAPNATVTAQQPVQTSGATTVTTTTAPMHGAGVPVDAARAGADRKADIAKEQSTLKSLNDRTAGMSNFDQQAEFGRAFEEREGEDSFRRAARMERERDAAMDAGDPTRDPVAKQAAMDKNTVLPGAKQDAQKIKDIGAKALDK